VIRRPRRRRMPGRRWCRSPPWIRESGRRGVCRVRRHRRPGAWHSVRRGRHVNVRRERSVLLKADWAGLRGAHGVHWHRDPPPPLTLRTSYRVSPMVPDTAVTYDPGCSLKELRMREGEATRGTAPTRCRPRADTGATPPRHHRRPSSPAPEARCGPGRRP
jgi:hypothetical protein